MTDDAADDAVIAVQFGEAGYELLSSGSFGKNKTAGIR